MLAGALPVLEKLGSRNPWRGTQGSERSRSRPHAQPESALSDISDRAPGRCSYASRSRGRTLACLRDPASAKTPRRSRVKRAGTLRSPRGGQPRREEEQTPGTLVPLRGNPRYSTAGLPRATLGLIESRPGIRDRRGEWSSRPLLDGARGRLAAKEGREDDQDDQVRHAAGGRVGLHRRCWGAAHAAGIRGEQLLEGRLQHLLQASERPRHLHAASVLVARFGASASA